MKIFLSKFLSSKKWAILGSGLLFSCVTNPWAMSSDLPSNFPTEPVAQDVRPASDLSAMLQGQTYGPETVAVSDERIGEQGNWVKKKQWLLKAFEVNNNIYNLALQIADTRSIYSGKNDAISDELHNFYRDLGTEHGKLQEMFESVERYLEKKKKKNLSELSSEGAKKTEVDRDYQLKIELLESQIKQSKDELEQLKLDIKSIDDIGKSLTQRLEKVDEQISSALNLAEGSKSKLEGLWEIVDDKKARQIYYDLVGAEENMKATLSYLKDILATDFDQVIKNAKKQIAVAKEDVKKLEDKGLIIKDRSKRIEQLKLEEMQKLEKEKESVAKAQALLKEKVETNASIETVGLFKRIYNAAISFCVNIAGYIFNVRDYVMNKFFGAKLAQKVQTEPKQNLVTEAKNEELSTSVPPTVMPVVGTVPQALQPVPAQSQSTSTPTAPIQAQQALAMPTM
jgi:hypothetical protein